MRDPGGRSVVVRASVVVGADGPHSVVARGAGVARPVRLDPRVGLTYHLADADPTACRDARMRILRDGYVGIAPVPGGRVNVGIVLGRSWRPALARDGARAVVDSIVAAIPPTADDAGHLARRPAARTPSRARGRSAIGSPDARVTAGCSSATRRASWTRSPARASIGRSSRPSWRPARSWRAGAVGHAAAGAFAAYERAMQRRFLAKDAVSWLVQAFLGRPALFDYAARRVAARPAVRATMGLVMGDLVPAGRALDPRFLAALLAP